MICRAEGLVIRGYRMSESSKVVVLFTREYGKLRLAARGARRPKSKFGASVEPITWGNYVFYRRENRDLQTLSEGDIFYSFSGIKAAYRRTAYASAVCELLDHMTVDEDRNALLFSVALDALKWMESIEEWAVELPLWYFQLKAAAASGYRPHLSGCVRCGERLSGPQIRFNPFLGGTLCERCGDSGMVLKGDTVRFLEQLQVGRPERIEVRTFGRIDRAEVDRALRHFLAHHVDGRRRVKSLDFLDRMLAAEGTPVPYRAEMTEGGVR